MATAADIAERLTPALRAAGVAITDVSIGAVEDRASWRVRPETLQASAQPIIDAFDPDDPAFVTADTDASVDDVFESVAGDLVTAMLENFVAMQAEATAGTFKASLWTQRLRARIKILRRAKPPA